MEWTGSALEEETCCCLLIADDIFAAAAADTIDGHAAHLSDPGGRPTFELPLRPDHDSGRPAESVEIWASWPVTQRAPNRQLAANNRRRAQLPPGLQQSPILRAAGTPTSAGQQMSVVAVVVVTAGGAMQLVDRWPLHLGHSDAARRSPGGVRVENWPDLSQAPPRQAAEFALPID